MNQKYCPICAGSEITQYFRLRCNKLSALRCKNCSHIFVENSPVSSTTAAQYYTINDFKGDRSLQEKDWYTGYYADCFFDYRSRIGSSLVLKQLQQKIGYLNARFPKRGKLLDVGCATGVFLDMAQKHNWETEGVEISKELAEYAKERFSLTVHVADITQNKLPTTPFDVITLFDVIEHLPNPRAMISACNELLAENGLLLIRTPAEEGLLRDIAKMLYRGTFTRFELPMLWFYSYEHIQSFSLRSLKTLLDIHGLSPVEIFYEEESLDRLTIPAHVKHAIQGINIFSKLLRKQHKVTLVAQKNAPQTA